MFDDGGVPPAQLGPEDFRDWHEHRRPVLEEMLRTVRARGSAYVAVERLREHLDDATRSADESFQKTSRLRTRALALQSERSLLEERISELRATYLSLTEQERSHHLDPELGAEAYAKTSSELTSARRATREALAAAQKSLHEREAEAETVDRSLQTSEAEWRRRAHHRDALAKGMSEAEAQFASSLASFVSEGVSVAATKRGSSRGRWHASGRSRRWPAPQHPVPSSVMQTDRGVATAEDDVEDHNG